MIRSHILPGAFFLLCGLLFSGCATGFPGLPSTPTRPSVKTSWVEEHTSTPMYVTRDGFVVEAKTDRFVVGHEDSRDKKNIFARIFGFIASFGFLGWLLFFAPVGTIGAIIGFLYHRLKVVSSALVETVTSLHTTKAVEKLPELHMALHNNQSIRTEDLVDIIRNKIPEPPEPPDKQ